MEKKLLDGAESIFERPSKKKAKLDDEKAMLECKRGQLTIEIDWLKKSRDIEKEILWNALNPNDPELSLAKQCQLLRINRSSYYSKPKSETAYHLELMRLIDQELERG